MLEGVQGVNVVFLCFFLSLYLKIQEFETRCFSSSGALDKEELPHTDRPWATTV